MSTDRPARIRARAGPPLAPVIGVSLALFAASLVVPVLLTGGVPYPSVLGPDADIAAYVAAHHDALRFAALFQFAASVPLAVFGAAAAAQLRRLGVHAAGPTIGFAGAVLASAALATSSLLQWALSRLAPDAPLALLVALRDLAFITGGAWHTVGLGLLVAGIAVPALFFRLLPRWMSAVGVVIAVVCELTTFVLLIPSAAYAIPLGRFPALLWLLTAAVILPTTRRREPQP